MILTRKYRAELTYWTLHAIDTWLPWYRGELPEVHGYPPPKPEDKKWEFAEEWQEAVMCYSHASLDYYPTNLMMDPAGEYGRLLDVGCGPMGFARAFIKSEVWGVDPLIEEYDLIGYPIRHYGMVCHAAPCESLWTIPANFFDTIVSINAIDHVDDFEAAVQEIERIAKPNALIRLHVCYHAPSLTEPMELSASRVRAAFHRFAMVPLFERESVPGFVGALWSTVP